MPRGLNLDDRVSDLLRSGPKTARELLKLAGVSRRTLYLALERMESSGALVAFPMRSKTGTWAGLYALPAQAEQASDIAGFVPKHPVPPDLRARAAEAVELLRAKLLRNPLVEEIAGHLGENPEAAPVREAIFRAAAPLGWRPPTAEERAKAEKERARVVALARMVKKGLVRKGASRAEAKKAEEYLRRFPEEAG
ncbi:MAG: hypothetical protein QXO51_07995 [Halobacteria archaeon]